MQAKRVSDSSVTMVQQMTQQDANLAGNVQGGVILRLVDITASIVAARHASGNVVTASIDRVNFYTPVYVGDLLKLKARINMVGNTSMEIGVHVEAENFITGAVRHTASAYITMVALDDRGKPRPLPSLLVETDEEQRRNKEACKRREMRIAERKREEGRG